MVNGELVRVRMLETSNSKFQITNDNSMPNELMLKHLKRTNSLEFGFWNLFEIWYLGFGLSPYGRTDTILIPPRL